MGVLDLKPGDVVSYNVEDYVVESQINYSSPRLSWVEWVLNPGRAEERIIVAAMGANVLVGRPCWLDGQPGDQMVRVGGAPLGLKTSGRADVSMTYDTGDTRFDRADFWHYEDTTGRLVVVRRGHLGQWAIDLQPTDAAALNVYRA